MKTLASIVAAEAVVKVQGRADRKQKASSMVYLIECRVPLEHVGEFENETLDEFNALGSYRIIDKGIVEDGV